MKISIPGPPVPQARMKYSSRGNFVRAYDPKAKEKIQIRQALSAYKTDQVFNYPRISFLFHMPIPKSVRKRDIPLYTSGRLKHTKKPDADNLVKLALDTLDGIIIEKDEKVSLGSVIKVYHPEPKTVIWINETTELLQPWELDFAYLDESQPELPVFNEPKKLYESCSLWMQIRSRFNCMEIPGLSDR